MCIALLSLANLAKHQNKREGEGGGCTQHRKMTVWGSRLSCAALHAHDDEIVHRDRLQQLPRVFALTQSALESREGAIDRACVIWNRH